VSEAVSYEVVERVAHVTIERPERRNAMDLEVFELLAAHAGRASADPEVGAVLVSGRGGSFSAGLDLDVLATLGGPGDDAGDKAQESRAADGGGRGAEQKAGRVVDGGGGEPHLDEALIGRLQAAFTSYEELDVPTIAAIEGHCYGGGIQLALACHLRAVAPSARLSVMESRWGLVPDLGGTFRLPRLVGLGRATELTLTARRLRADEALAIGLAEVSLPSAEPQDHAHQMAARLAAGPGALRRVPRLLRENLERSRSAALAAEARTQLEGLAGPDVAEAVRAHLERREPNFTGR